MPPGRIGACDYDTVDPSRSGAIVAAPIKRPYIWDLTPSVSAIRRCLDAGLHVYLLEWLPASEKTCSVGVTECVKAISAALHTVGAGADGRKPILMGHSLGGTLATIYAATASETIDGLVLLGAPLCFQPGESPFRDALIKLVPAPVLDLDPYPVLILSQASAVASPETFIWSRFMDAALVPRTALPWISMPASNAGHSMSGAARKAGERDRRIAIS